MRPARGFTLVEVVVIITFIAFAVAGISGLFANTNKASLMALDLQRTAQYAQECAEHVLEVRRRLSFSSTAITTTMCDGLGSLPTGFTRSVTVPDVYTGTSSTACPSGATCRNVGISVTKGSVASTLTVMLVSY